MTAWLLWIAILLPLGALLHFFEDRLQEARPKSSAAPGHSAQGTS
jgi:hypothetical protein